MNDRWVLILGGCSPRGQKAAKKCVDEGYTVVVVDKPNDHDSYPEHWPVETNCNNCKNFSFYEEDVLEFLTTETFLTGIKWFMVINQAHITNDDFIIECTTNNVLDAVFVRWIHLQPHPKPQVVSSCESVVAQHLLHYKHLWA